MPESKAKDVDCCTCGTHCRSACPYFAALNQDGHEIRAFCGNYDTFLQKDQHYLQFSMLLFCRTRQCKQDHISHAERRECRPVN